MIDFIGDIHGHADKLEELLLKLGYTKRDGAYSHPSRTVLFVGDYIDRGPKIRETLQIVRAMVESGNAIALMGNHEYNALCFHFQETEGGHLRKHLIKNIIQHYETLQQFQNRQEDYKTFYSKAKTIKVKALPPHPLKESVAVGDYRMEEHLVSTDLKTGQSAGYDFNIYGEGNISAIEKMKVTKDKEVKIKAGDDAKEANWFDLDELPDLAFDHSKIIEDAKNYLQTKNL